MTSVLVGWGGDGDYEDGDDYDEEYKSHEVEEYRCLYPDRCCMPELHYTSECHTKEMLEDGQRIIKFEEIKQLFKEAGSIKREQVIWMIEVLEELL